MLGTAMAVQGPLSEAQHTYSRNQRVPNCQHLNLKFKHLFSNILMDYCTRDMHNVLHLPAGRVSTNILHKFF